MIIAKVENFYWKLNIDSYFWAILTYGKKIDKLTFACLLTTHTSGASSVFLNELLKWIIP